MTPLAASISDATIWSVTFDDTRSVDYDCNSFRIQATDVKPMPNDLVHDDTLLNVIIQDLGKLSFRNCKMAVILQMTSFRNLAHFTS